MMTIGEQLRYEAKQAGMLEGIREGMLEGIKQGECSLLKHQLQRKFHEIPLRYLNKLHKANSETLLKWSEAILEAKTLAEILEK